MSTLDQADIDVMKATKTCVAAQRFQYDFLNDDITDDGRIDYSLSNKVPASLRAAIAAGRKILVLINPPYAAATNRGNTSQVGDAEYKSGVAKTRFAASAMDDYGKASNELFTQFVVRIAHEIPNATLAMFSTLKYINAPDFEKFRQKWRAKFLGGFVVHNQAFDGLKGKFPIGFLIWRADQSEKSSVTEVAVEVLDKNASAIGEKKFFNLPALQFLSSWIIRPKSNNINVIPLKNAVTPATATKDLRGTKWADGAIACMDCAGNDLQHAEQHSVIFSSGYGSAGGFFVTDKNLWQVAIVFAVRRLIRPTWLNDRDQFLQPTAPLTDDFKTDCLIWMLFNRCNRTAGADGLKWNNQTWSLVNHFIPFTEAEVGAPDRFESDFMVQYLSDKNLSVEALAVLDAGRYLWKAYFSYTDVRAVRDEYKLNRPDVGWFQICNAIAARNASGDTAPISFVPFETVYQSLTEKLQPQVFSLGFLR